MSSTLYNFSLQLLLLYNIMYSVHMYCAQPAHHLLLSTVPVQVHAFKNTISIIIYMIHYVTFILRVYVRVYRRNYLT